VPAIIVRRVGSDMSFMVVFLQVKSRGTVQRTADGDLLHDGIGDTFARAAARALSRHDTNVQ
jgi:hypothetical protein